MVKPNVLAISFALMIFGYLIATPYTKVEESFNMQAIHDILITGVPMGNCYNERLSYYDHTSFPGSVPRTFVGAVLISAICWPLKMVVHDPKVLQVIVRGILGLINAASLYLFQQAVGRAFGKPAQLWYIILQSSQFHVIYYASRTLPNMFAFGFSNLAMRSLLLSRFGSRKQRARHICDALRCLTFAGVIFRSELAVLLVFEIAFLVLIQRSSIKSLILPTGVVAFLSAILTTLATDSFFWQEFPLWPEWIAFRYNAIDGKSRDWGTSSWHYYFTNALPRLLMNPSILVFYIPVALMEKSVGSIGLEILGPLLLYVSALSFLPHKEWRFIVYIIPATTAVASVGASLIWRHRSNSFTMKTLAFLSGLTVVFSYLASLGFLFVSSTNYPGAVALQRLHQIAHGESPSIKVHMDNLSCQTGVTRFLEKASPIHHENMQSSTVWYYDKTDDFKKLRSLSFWQAFDYALAEDPSRVLGNWELVENILGFSGISFHTEDSTLPHSGYGLADRAWSYSYLDSAAILLSLEDYTRRYFTRGKWLRIRMSTKISILRRVKDSSVI